MAPKHSALFSASNSSWVCLLTRSLGEGGIWCEKLPQANGTPEPDLKGSDGSRKTILRGVARVLGHLAGQLKLSPMEGYRCNPMALFMDFTGVRATMTAKGEWRDHSGKAQGTLSERSLDYRKDVISKQIFEQHLFTKRAKY